MLPARLSKEIPVMVEALINKTDVMDYFDFDKEKVEEYAKMRNPEIEIIYISAKTGEGIPALADWIIRNVDDWNK